MKKDLYKILLTGDIVDLNDLSIYPKEHREKNALDLFHLLWAETGKSLLYMDYLHGDVDWGSQRFRVIQFIKEMFRCWNKRIKDTPENRLFWLKLIYKFEWETENQC